MKDRIEKYLWECFNSLKVTSLSYNNDVPDLLISVVFTHYLLDGRVIPNLHEKGKHPLELINREIEHYFKKHRPELIDEMLVGEHIIRAVSEKKADEIYQLLYRLFTQDWSWSMENIGVLFDAIEDIDAQNRKDAVFMYTPREIVKLVTTLVCDITTQSVYDPYCRTGDFLMEAINKTDSIKYAKGLSQYSLGLKFAVYKAVMYDVPNFDIQRDTIYKSNRERYDCIITNPPFGTQMSKTSDRYDGWLGEYGGKTKEQDFICHVIDHLEPLGRAGIVCPSGILWGQKAKDFRENLIYKNILEAVIELPSGTFYHTGVNTVILVINMVKETPNILLIDAKDMGERTPKRRVLKQEEISFIVSVIEGVRMGDYSMLLDNVFLATVSDIKNKDYNLLFDQYKPLQKIKHRQSEEIFKEIELLQKELLDIQNEISGLFNKQ